MLGKEDLVADPALIRKLNRIKRARELEREEIDNLDSAEEGGGNHPAIITSSSPNLTRPIPSMQMKREPSASRPFPGFSRSSQLASSPPALPSTGYSETVNSGSDNDEDEEMEYM
jgi:hypothetical protein